MHLLAFSQNGVSLDISWSRDKRQATCLGGWTVGTQMWFNRQISDKCSIADRILSRNRSNAWFSRMMYCIPSTHRHRAPRYFADYCVPVSSWSCWSPAVAPAICQMSYNCQFREFAAAPLGPVQFSRRAKSLEFTAWSSARPEDVSVRWTFEALEH